MKEKKSPTHLIFAIVHSSLAIATLVPAASASKPSLLGYKALCSFSPIGTIILVYISVLHYMLWRSQSS